MTRLRTVLARPLRTGGTPAVATLDDALWKRVGHLLVARGRLTDDELESAYAEHRRTGVPLDDVLVDRGCVSRHTVASAVLVVQLGRNWRERLRQPQPPPEQVAEDAAPLAEEAAVDERPPARERLPDVPIPPRRVYVAAGIAVDTLVLVLAALAAALARTRSDVPLLPASWVAGFVALALALYWTWRLATYAARLRPWADALLVAGSISLSALTVLASRSLTGTRGVAEEMLPLWTFAVVYGIAGRMAFYLAWPALRRDPPTPAESVAVTEESGEDAATPAVDERRGTGVVPIRPGLWDVLDELRREVDAVAREQRSVGDGLDEELAEAG